MSKFITVFLFALVGALGSLQSYASQCVPEGQWLLPRTGHILNQHEFTDQLPRQGVVLLGEHHANAAHHKWQLEIIKSLHQNQPNMALGLEMFPRRIQPILDQWIDGDIDKYEFRELSEWDTIWSFNFDDYFPIFDYAQKNQIRLIALNVSRKLLERVRESGWHRVPQSDREGVGNPARPSRAYAKELAVSFKRHQPPSRTIDKVGFKRFVQKQLLWDRAMAEGIADTYQQTPNQLVVGLMGSWHIIGGHGVPYQLADLGIKQTVNLIPWDDNLDCDSIDRQFADAIYGSIYQQTMHLDVFD